MRVQPGARRRSVRWDDDGTVRVAVPAPAVDGKANDALVELLAEAFGVRTRDVTVVSGHRARTKRVRVVGGDAGALERLRGRATS